MTAVVQSLCILGLVFFNQSQREVFLDAGEGSGAKNAGSGRRKGDSDHGDALLHPFANGVAWLPKG